MSELASLLCFGDRLETMNVLPQTNHLRLSWQKSREALLKAIDRQHTAGITLSFKRSSPYLGIAREVIHRTKGSVPLFLIVDSSVTEDQDFARLVAHSNVDYALAQSGSAELAQRLKVLLRSHTIEKPDTDSGRLPGASAATASLYDVESHRLNAQKVADLFGFTLRQLSGVLKALPQSVHKTPDAVRLQQKLKVFERIARGLALVDNDEKDFRRWLNAPNDELDNRSPLEVIQSGKGEIVANLVEDALLGQPA